MSKTVCPWWLGYFLMNPLRKALLNPEKILAQYVWEGAWVMDIGCGMGMFTLPMASMVGESGRVLAVDLQEKMINSLKQRVEAVGLSDRMEARVCSSQSLNIDDYNKKIDFALAFAVVHEVPDQDNLLAEIYQSLKPNGRLLISEPSFHVSRQDFDKTLTIAKSSGFSIVEYPSIKGGKSALFAKAN